MKIFVTGASGNVGTHLVHQALDRGHEVTAHVRTASTWEPPAGVEVIRHDSYEMGQVEGMEGHEAVISCLGNKHVNPDNPFSPMAARADFVEHAARILVAAMKEAGIERVVAVSAAGVGDSAKRMNLFMKGLVRWSPVGVAYRDLERMEAVYADSGLEWACCRPTRLRHGPWTGEVKVVNRFSMSAWIRRADVAHWLLDAVEREPWFPEGERTPQIAGG